MGEELRAHPAPDRRAHRQHPVADNTEHQRQEDEPCRRALDAEGDMTGLLSPRATFGCSLTTSIAISAPEFPRRQPATALLELRGIQVVERMQLDDPGSSSVANGVVRGPWCLPIATTTFSASMRRSPMTTRK